MKSTFKRIAALLLVLVAAMAVNVKKAEAATVTAKAPVHSTDEQWESHNGHLKYIVQSGAQIPSSGVCFLKLPTSYHYKFKTVDKETGEELTFRVIGGATYFVKDGFIASIGDTDVKKAAVLFEIDKNLKSTNKGTKAALVRAIIPKHSAAYFDNKGFPYGEGTGYDRVRTEKDGEIVYIPNCPGWLTGEADDGKIYSNGNPYTGSILKSDGTMYKVSSGKVGSPYSGSLTKYFDEASGKIVSVATTAYKDGKPVSGWITSGDSYTYGYYNSKGQLDANKNYWKKKEAGEWYYLEKGKIYRRSDGKKGIAQKKLSSKNLNYFGNSKATKGSFYYYLNANGSLVTDVFKADRSWMNKKMRIFVNLKSGVDNVTFMGYHKKSYSVPLKTIVNSSSKKAAVRAKQIRGRKGKGYWNLGKTGGSRQRWFVFKKNGHKYYYQYATSILGTGALFHSPRFLRAYNIHSLYTAHFNAMGVKNITTKCVRVEVGNAKLIYDISTKINSYKVTVKFISKAKTKKNSYLPFGHKRLKNTVGTNSWHHSYDPSDPAIN